jgi:hypothetical protein
VVIASAAEPGAAGHHQKVGGDRQRGGAGSQRVVINRSAGYAIAIDRTGRAPRAMVDHSF